MGELARRWSELLLADVEPGERVTEAAQRAGSLLREPATEAEIAAAEERLGRRLPPSYREFLLVSNGAYGDMYGPSIAWGDEPEEASPESDVVGVALLPVQDIRWLRDEQPWWDEILSIEEPGGPATEDGAEVWPWAPFVNGLVIAVDYAPGTTCLVPFDGMDEWQVWRIHKESSEAYLSFRSMLEYMVGEREPITTVDELRAVIERADRRDSQATVRLSHTIAPDGVALLLDVIERNGSAAFAAVAGLGRIGTTEAIDTLMRVRPHSVEHALVTALGRELCGDIFTEWGSYEGLALIDDPRTAEVAARYVAKHPEASAEQIQRPLRIVEMSGERSAIPILLPLIASDGHTSLSIAWTLAKLGAPEGRRRIFEMAATPWPGQTRARFMLKQLPVRSRLRRILRGP